VIYQTIRAAFATTNGDGVGDLQGIIGKLPYVASLGSGRDLAAVALLYLGR